MTFTHVAPNNRYIDIFIDNFKQVCNQNRVIILKKENESLKAKTFHDIIPPDSKKLLKLLNENNSKDPVIFHYLSTTCINTLDKIDTSRKVYWMFWGADAFVFPNLLYKVLSPETTSFISKVYKETGYHYLYPSLTGFKYWFWQLYRPLKYERLRRKISRVDFFCHYSHSDYETVLEELKISARYVDANYGDSSFWLKGFENNEFDNGPHLIAGNSASLTNNHFLAINLLSKNVDLRESQIIMPLSYGDQSGIYSNEVIRVGFEKLGERFRPLTKYMDMTEYNRLLLTCSFTLMTSFRSQGAGQLFSGIMAGHLVYLYQENGFSAFLQRLDIDFKTIEDLESEGILSKLDFNQKAENREKLSRYLNKKSVQDRYQILIESTK